MSMNAKEIDVLMKSLAPVIFEFVTKEVEPLQDRIKELEGRSVMDYKGVWQQGQVYTKGNFVTHQGSLWFANDANASRPGDGSKAWTLAVKRGSAQE